MRTSHVRTRGLAGLRTCSRRPARSTGRVAAVAVAGDTIISGSHVQPQQPKAGRIAGPKYDRELLQQLRDAVLFLRQRGWPTMGLIDVLDEAVAE